MARTRLALTQRLQRLHTRRTHLADAIRDAQAQHRTQERQRREKRRVQAGQMVEAAGLGDLAPEVLLGLLLETAPRCHDPQVLAQWQATGAEALALRKTRRRKTASPEHEEATEDDTASPTATRQPPRKTPAS